MGRSFHPCTDEWWHVDCQACRLDVNVLEEVVPATEAQEAKYHLPWGEMGGKRVDIEG
jgi:hypothetical protein